MVEQVADGITRVAGSRTNLYIVQEGDALCLVDTGYPGDFGRIVAALDELGRSPADISAVLLTHAHVDHMGSAERIRTEQGAAVYIHAEEAAHARGERQERISTGYILSRLWWPKMMSFFVNLIRVGAIKMQHVRELSTFEGPVALDLPGGPVPILTPGHTSGHCAFHFPDRGVLMTGDALVTHDSLTQESGPRPLNKAFNHDQAETLRSLELLRPIEAEVLLPGHGPAFHGSPADAVDQALGHVR